MEILWFVLVNELDSDIVVNEFEFQSDWYTEERCEIPYAPVMG